jgi:fibronectin type 3 domain-containing protein
VDNSPYDRGFIVERSSGGDAFAQITTAATDAVSYTDSDLSPATSYSYRVRATNPAGESANSNTAFAAMRGVDATKGTQGGQITVNWSAEIGAVAYNLYRQTCAACAKELIASNLTATQFTDTTALAGVTYTYSLQTVDSVGAATDLAYTVSGCAEIPTSLALSNSTFSEPVTIGATGTIVAGANVTVNQGSRVTFHMRRATGGIRLGRGFRVRSDGSFRALVSAASGGCS